MDSKVTKIVLDFGNSQRIPYLYANVSIMKPILSSHVIIRH